MVTSLVDNLRPVSRDQIRLADKTLRATVTSAEQTARGNSTVLQWDMSGYASFAVVLAGDSSQLALDGSNDLFSWLPIDAQVVGQDASVMVGANGIYQENVALVGTVPTTTLVGNKQTRFMRVRSVSTSSSRNTSVTATLSQTPFAATRQQKIPSPDRIWNYVAASGGITNTTPVTLKAAVNAYHRNLLTSLHLSNGGAAGTEVIVKEGSNVVDRVWIAAGASIARVYNPPLRAAANAALTVELSSATTVAVYANAQGLVALT